ncbi:MAG: endonuclease MutS2 [Chloroflexota bacterium]|nr:endonuclease MutS2 [Chloroflexota bacterium]
MDAKSIAVLEFPKIVDRLAGLCGSPGGRALAQELTPSSDYDEVRRRQAATAEAKALSRIKPHFRMGQAPEIDQSLLAASRAAVLPTGEILEVATLLRSARHTRNQIAPLSRELPQLARIAQRIADFTPLIQEIDATIDERGEVPDDASPALAEARDRVRTVQERLERQLERTLRHAVSEGVAQESLITERDGRYVIPIKAELRGSMPSVVHDVSASGATLFVEPLAVVELGNRLRESRREEQREVERILRALCQSIGEEAGAIRAAIRCLSQIDLAQAKARLAAELDAPLPAEDDNQSWLSAEPTDLILHAARHPLLTGEVVPISTALTAEARCVLITGPNTGGKTVALKTVGLLCLMAQAGLPVPAETGTRIPVFADIYADIGDEQSIEQSLSTFSAHMTNIIRIVEAAGPRTLVLLDELGAGTDPGEGAALARSLLAEFLDLDTMVVATTHHGELKVFAHATDGVVNASAEFDAVSLQPTYRLLMGTPGRSNALAIAQRLGMPERVLNRARDGAETDAASMEQLLGELQRGRDAIADQVRAERIARQEAEEIRTSLAERRDAIEAERDALLARTERAMEDELAALRRTASATLKQLERERSREQAEELADRRAEEGRERLQRVRRERANQRRRRSTERAGPTTLDPDRLSAGDFIYLRGLPEPGEVLTPVEDGALDVQLGSLRTRVRVEQIERLAPAAATSSDDSRPLRGMGARVASALKPPADPGSKIDLRGRITDDALPMVDSFLDVAYRAGQTRLEVVHGKGTGALRRAVRELLRTHPLVTKFESAEPKRGGDGVTIVTLIG